MTVAAFTGPARNLSAAELSIVHRVLGDLGDVAEFWTGGAIGVDTACAFFLAEHFPGAHHRVIAPCAPWSGRVPAGASMEYAPGGRTVCDSYMLRNEALVDGADILYAFPPTGRTGVGRAAATTRRSGAASRLVPGCS